MPSSDRQADADLTVADLPECSRVLALDAYRVTSLLWKASVVDDPRRDWLLLLRASMTCRAASRRT